MPASAAMSAKEVDWRFQSRKSGRDAVSRPMVVCRPHTIDEPVGRLEGEGLEENAVDETEDRRVGADADRQRRDDGQREARAPAQESDGVAEVPEHARPPQLTAVSCRSSTTLPSKRWTERSAWRA